MEPKPRQAWVEAIVRDRFANEKSRSRSPNLMTAAGGAWWENQLFGTPVTPTPYIGISTDTTTISAGDTVLAGEQTTNGLARAAATVVYPGGGTETDTVQLTITYTYTGSSSLSINKAGLFTASSGGTMIRETKLNELATLTTSGDTLSLTWDISF
jgi:hypothetical protein